MRLGMEWGALSMPGHSVGMVMKRSWCMAYQHDQPSQCDDEQDWGGAALDAFQECVGGHRERFRQSFPAVRGGFIRHLP